MLLRRFLLIAAAVLLVTACAGRAWRAALEEDSASAYSRYLRAHPDSSHAGEARARLAFVRVRSQPTREGFESFRERFPDSPLVEALRPHVEAAFFREARARGTAEAYRAFLEEFPDGDYADRAEGNARYLEAGGFGGDVEALAAFAERHPASDYAAEAERSAASVALRGRTAFQRVGLIVDVPDDTPGAERLRRLFVERSAEAYRAAGVPLVVMDGPRDPRLSQVGARLTISHRESRVRTRVEEGTFSEAGILARTRVTLGDADETIWDDAFEIRIPVTEVRDGESALFHPLAWTTYWRDRFFAPIATWDTRLSARTPRTLEKAAVAVDTLGSRAVVMYGDGDFEMLDLGDPASPVLLGEYRRKRDLSHFEGVVGLAGGMAIYGADGIEVVRFGAGGAERTRVHPRSEVGSIAGLVALGGDLVAASNRGLLWIRRDGEVQNLFSREVLGLARQGERLLFTDGTSLYVGSLDALRRGRVEGQLRLGRGFRPGAIRANGHDAIVIGEPGLVWVDVSRPARPRVVSRLDRDEVGEIRDATVVGGRIFLVGPRGLQITRPGGERVADSVDVLPRHRIEAAGRHLVLIGENSLQVVDATPFALGPAAPGSVGQ